MTPLTNPLIWLSRIRHRCGYGVHSPFAFRFITDVIYESLPYYAYASLDAQLPWHKLGREKQGLHLLLRLANYQQPNAIAIDESTTPVASYLQAGCQRAHLYPIDTCTQAQLCYITHPDEHATTLLQDGGMLILDNLQRHRTWFKSLPATLHFDLYDIGIALFALPYHRCYYKVNF